MLNTGARRNNYWSWSLKVLFLWYWGLWKIVGWMNWILMLVSVLILELWTIFWLRPRMINAALDSIGFYVMPIFVYIIPAGVLLFIYQILIFERIDKLRNKMGKIFLEKFQQTLERLEWQKPGVIYLSHEEKNKRWTWRRFLGL